MCSHGCLPEELLLIQSYHYESGTLGPFSRFEPDSWVHLTEPEPSEIDSIVTHFKLDPEYLTDILDLDERPRVTIDDGIPYIIIRIPIHNSEADIAYTTIPLGILLLETTLITVCARKSLVIEAMQQKSSLAFDPTKIERFILQIFQQTIFRYLRFLREIHQQTILIEKELHQATRNEELIRLLNLVKGLVFFTTSLKSNDITIVRAMRMKFMQGGEEEEDLMEDIEVDSTQALEMANIHSNILSSMMDAFASVISNNVSFVMKVLTLVTIIIMVPNLVASIYGMNVSLPFSNSPTAFLIPLGASTLLGLVTYLYFRRKRWF